MTIYTEPGPKFARLGIWILVQIAQFYVNKMYKPTIFWMIEYLSSTVQTQPKKLVNRIFYNVTE